MKDPPPRPPSQVLLTAHKRNQYALLFHSQNPSSLATSYSFLSPKMHALAEPSSDRTGFQNRAFCGIDHVLKNTFRFLYLACTNAVIASHSFQSQINIELAKYACVAVYSSVSENSKARDSARSAFFSTLDTCDVI
jgi:hypothetical protein